MARAPKLKVFRIAIGFHDAYVAAPSQKAAIEAWGVDKDVFQRGQAELVTDANLLREPLARPGEVIKRLRGTAAEQLAALEEEEEPPKARAKGKPTAKAKAKPRPSRAALDRAEAALAEAEAHHHEATKEIAAREKALARDRAALEAKQAKARATLEARRGKAETAYRAAMERWRKG